MSEEVARVAELHRSARELLAEGNVSKASIAIDSAADTIASMADRGENVAEEFAMLRVLASVGTQMSGFIHEVTSLVGMAESIDKALARMCAAAHLPKGLGRQARKIHAARPGLR